MSVNSVNPTTGETTLIANGQRVAMYTKAAYKAAEQGGTLPADSLVMITNDVGEYRYSTDEVDTGKLWIDGKPIYRKCFSFNLTATTAWYSDCKISNANVIKIYGTLYHGDGALCLPYPSGVDITQTIELLYSDSMGVLIRTGLSTVVNEPVIIIIEYTKTTD